MKFEIQIILMKLEGDLLNEIATNLNFLGAHLGSDAAVKEQL
jgi:hypothetical protein